MGDNACLVGIIRIIIDMIKKIRKTIDSVGRWITVNQVVFLAFFAIAIVAEVVSIPLSSDVRIFLGILLYWYIIRIGKLTSVRTFQLVLMLLLITFLSFLANGASPQTERLAVWYVVFFAFGIVQQWREMTS